MAKFLYVYHEPFPPPAPPSPEDMQAFMRMWGEWFQKFGSAILDGGDGLKPTGKVLKAGGVVSDGPYVEAKEVVGGYTVVQADDYDGALVMARENPIAQFGGVIEIRELAGYNV
jgi:hypothetical protein